MSDTPTWVKTNEDILLWISNPDTAHFCVWEGKTFDNVANGKGYVTYTDNDGNIVHKEINSFYGAIEESDIVSLDDDGKYVGNTIDGLMDGYGVLVKENNIYIGNFKNSKPNGFLKWFKNKKLYYEGFWKEGAFYGEGTLYKENGTIKSGEWIKGTLSQTFVDIHSQKGHYKGFAKEGRPDGLGEMDYSNGATYQGHWKDGLWQGEGLYVFNQDSVYGVWDAGKINGDVIYRTNSFLFEGTFIDNVPVGVGNLTTIDGTYYSGLWVDGKRAGLGDMIFANGDEYSGEWKDNQFEGYGEYHYISLHAVFAGEWENGLQHGYGQYKSLAFSYQGEWDKGWMDGEGTLVFKNGDRYEGSIHENIIDGIGCYTYSNGNRYEGEFVNGKITGFGVFQFKNGNRFEGEFVNGKIYGDGTMYLVEKSDTVAITGFWPIDGTFPKEGSILFANGDLYEGPLKNGAPTNDGIWVSGEERQAQIEKVEGTMAHKANELYKKHRETINWCLLGVSAVVTAVEVATASTVIGAPVAAAAHGVNVGINAVDASMAVASAALDVVENKELGENNDEAIKNLETEVAMNAAFVLVPKVVSAAAKPLGKGVKNVLRSPLAKAFLASGKLTAKKSALNFVKAKILGKAVKVSISVQGGVRKVERALIRNKNTRNVMIATGRLLTRQKHQNIKYSTFLKKLKSNPSLKDKLKMSAEGSSANLGQNMRILGTDKWVNKNERIRRYLGLPKRQVEPHHIIPSNPTTEDGRQARKIWTKYFESVDHPCNGIWLGRANEKYGYKALAKGSNHGPNSKKYEKRVSKALINTFKKYQKQYSNNPEMMQKKLAETVDDIKKQLYKGKIAIGKDTKSVHTITSIFKESKGIVADAASRLTNSITHIDN